MQSGAGVPAFTTAASCAPAALDKIIRLAATRVRRILFLHVSRSIATILHIGDEIVRCPDR